jgi:hypothetical protein
LLVLGSGDTTLRLCPPLLIDEAQADFALDTLETCITELERSLWRRKKSRRDAGGTEVHPRSQMVAESESLLLVDE